MSEPDPNELDAVEKDDETDSAEMYGDRQSRRAKIIDLALQSHRRVQARNRTFNDAVADQNPDSWQAALRDTAKEEKSRCKAITSPVDPDNPLRLLAMYIALETDVPANEALSIISLAGSAIAACVEDVGKAAEYPPLNVYEARRLSSAELR